MNRNSFLSIFLVVLFGASLAGCEKEGAAEKLGAKIDDAVEDAGEKMEEAGEAIKKETSD